MYVSRNKYVLLSKKVPFFPQSSFLPSNHGQVEEGQGLLRPRGQGVRQLPCSQRPKRCHPQAVCQVQGHRLLRAGLSDRALEGGPQTVLRDPGGAGTTTCCFNLVTILKGLSFVKEGTAVSRVCRLPGPSRLGHIWLLAFGASFHNTPAKPQNA